MIPAWVSLGAVAFTWGAVVDATRTCGHKWNSSGFVLATNWGGTFMPGPLVFQCTGCGLLRIATVVNPSPELEDAKPTPEKVEEAFREFPP